MHFKSRSDCSIEFRLRRCRLHGWTIRTDHDRSEAGLLEQGIDGGQIFRLQGVPFRQSRGESWLCVGKGFSCFGGGWSIAAVYGERDLRELSAEDRQAHPLLGWLDRSAVGGRRRRCASDGFSGVVERIECGNERGIALRLRTKLTNLGAKLLNVVLRSADFSLAMRDVGRNCELFLQVREWNLAARIHFQC